MSLAFVVKAKDGESAAFEELVAQLVRSAREERGLLIYEWSRSPDPSEFHGYERYADSAAVLEHMSRFQESYAERFFELVDLVSLRAYGEPDDDCGEALTAGGAEMLAPIEGFAR